ASDGGHLNDAPHADSLFLPRSLFRGARAVVMGASTDIGEQLAYHHARLGAKILWTSNNLHFALPDLM
uniref:Uncharacterized protein n=1 Tax=Amphiprion ocellaris TaxID=80972 RepID=A0AAQ5YSL4_AMPOC